MSEPIQHHYVPVTYLKRFADTHTGFLYVLDRYKKEIRQQKPDKIMRKRYYYRQEWLPEGTDQNILEKAFDNLFESKLKDIIDKIIFKPTSLTEHDTATFALYLLTQRSRVPRQAEIAKRIAEFVLQHNIQEEPELANLIASGRIEVKIDKNVHFSFMKSVASIDILSCFCRMRWEIVAAPPNKHFITTDSPVAFYNPLVPPPFEPGIALLGTKVLFPLFPSHLLILKHPERDTATESEYTKKILLKDIRIDSAF